jgi:hypothetical protein
MAEKKYFNKILPAGIIAFKPYLNEVDVFKPKKGDEKRRYKVNIKFDDATHRAVDKWLKSVAEEAGDAVGKNANSPWQKSKKDGSLTLLAFAGENRKPPLFDAKNKRLPANVVPGGGSKVRLDVTANPYDGFGGGINIYLNAVQVLELKQYGSNGESRFDETEGFEHDGTDESEGSFDSHTSDSNTDDDDIPF